MASTHLTIHTSLQASTNCESPSNEFDFNLFHPPETDDYHDPEAEQSPNIFAKFKLSKLQEIIKYKNFPGSHACRTFSKKSTSSYGIDETQTNVSSSKTQSSQKSKKGILKNKTIKAHNDRQKFKEELPICERNLRLLDKNTECAMESYSAQSYATFQNNLEVQSNSSGSVYTDTLSLKYRMTDFSHCLRPNQIQTNVISFELMPSKDQDLDMIEMEGSSQTTGKLNKAYLRKLDRKFDRLFKGKGKLSSRLTNTSKSVYSFEGEVLSEEDDEYNSDSSFETKDHKFRANQAVEDEIEFADEGEVVDELKSCFEDDEDEDQYSSVSGLLDFQKFVFDSNQIPEVWCTNEPDVPPEEDNVSDFSDDNLLSLQQPLKGKKRVKFEIEPIDDIEQQVLTPSESNIECPTEALDPNQKEVLRKIINNIDKITRPKPQCSCKECIPYSNIQQQEDLKFQTDDKYKQYRIQKIVKWLSLKRRKCLEGNPKIVKTQKPFKPLIQPIKKPPPLATVKQKVAASKLRIQGKFMSLEAAHQILNDRKKLKNLGIGKVELKHILRDYEIMRPKARKKRK